MSSIERLDSATVGVPLVVEETVIDITELILISPLLFTLLILTAKVVEPSVGGVAGAAVLDVTLKLVAVVELPPLVSVIAIFPTETLLLRLLKVIL